MASNWVLVVAFAQVWNVCVGQDRVVVKVDEHLSYERSCADTKSYLTSFFSEASLDLHDVTDNFVLFENVVIQLPSWWTDCGTDVIQQDFSDVAVDIYVKNSTSKIIQPEGCGKKGHGVILGPEVLTRNNLGIYRRNVKSFTVNWLKNSFGVFDEHGDARSKMFPMFYKKNLEVKPTSCTDHQIKGLFNETCLSSPERCSYELQQMNISSSILFSLSNDHFPQLKKLCTSSNHDKSSPTPQNLICNQRSPIEIIQLKSPSRKPVRKISFNFTQGKKNSIILILDKSSNMNVSVTRNKNRWQVARHGLEQMFLQMNGTLTLSIIDSLTPTTVRDLDLPIEDIVLANNIFDETISYGSSTWSLGAAMRTALNHARSRLSTIILITATPNLEDLSPEIEILKENRAAVHIVTFSKIQSPGSFMKLAEFGSIYTIPEKSDLNEVIFEAGAILRQIVADFSSFVKQDVFYLSSLFETPKSIFIPKLIDNPTLQFIILSPYTQMPDITLVSPSNVVYSSTTNNKILSKWSKNVLYVKYPVFESGIWNISILDRPGSFLKCIVVASTEVGSEVIGKSFMESHVKTIEINATTLPGLPVYVQTNADFQLNHDFELEASVCTNVEGCNDIVLRDNGLTVPDINYADGIFSEYVTKISETGFYSTRFKAILKNSTPVISWIGPSFYISSPHPDDGQDHVPPSRITDLRSSFDYETFTLTLTWTAPGDNLNEGEVNFYKIHCGFTEESISYDDCKSISSTVFFGNPAGTIESCRREFQSSSFDRTVYFAVYAFDDSLNSSPKSNVISLYVIGPTTTTKTTVIPTTETTITVITSSLGIVAPVQNQTFDDSYNVSNTTTVSNENSTRNIDGKNKSFDLHSEEFWTIVIGLSAALLAFICLAAVYFCLKNYKKRMPMSRERAYVDQTYRFNQRGTTVAGSRVPSPFTTNYELEEFPASDYTRRGRSPHTRSDRFNYNVEALGKPPRDLTVRPSSSYRQKRDAPSTRGFYDDNTTDSDIDSAGGIRIVRSRNKKRRPAANQSGQSNPGFNRSPSIERISRQKRGRSPKNIEELNVRNLNHGSSGHFLPSLRNSVPGRRSRRSSQQFRDNEEPASSTPKFHRQHIGNRPTLGSQQIYYAPEVEVHDSSQESGSTSGTFYQVNFDPNVGVHRTDPHQLGSVDLTDRGAGAPYNYIAFSQQLYGDNVREMPKSRAISYV